MRRSFLYITIAIAGMAALFCTQEQETFARLTTEQADCIAEFGITPEALDQFIADEFSPTRTLIAAVQCDLESGSEEGKLAEVLSGTRCLVSELGELAAGRVLSFAESGEAPTLFEFRTMLFCEMVDFGGSGDPLFTVSQLDCMLASDFRDEYELLMRDKDLEPSDLLQAEMDRCGLDAIRFG